MANRVLNVYECLVGNDYHFVQAGSFKEAYWRVSSYLLSSLIIKNSTTSALGIKRLEKKPKGMCVACAETKLTDKTICTIVLTHLLNRSLTIPNVSINGKVILHTLPYFVLGGKGVSILAIQERCLFTYIGGQRVSCRHTDTK